MKEVFISYSTKDTTQAETVRNIIESNGVSCWMAPRDIPGGSNYTKEIPVAIRNCKVFVLILSNNSQNSHWVLKELDAAVNNGKIILPFMLENFDLNDEFNFLLSGTQRYAAYQKKVEAIEELIGRIKAIIGTNSQPEPQEAQQEESAAPAPQPAPQPTPQPDPQPAPQQPASNPVHTPQADPAPAQQTKQEIIYCSACRSTETTFLPKKVIPQNFGERMTKSISFFMGLLFLLVSSIISIVVLFRVSLLFIPITVIGALWGRRIANNKITQHRIRKGQQVRCYRCNRCKKVFNYVTELQ